MSGIMTGVNFMLIGMGAVFVFLLLLVGSMLLLQRFASHGGREAEPDLHRRAVAAAAAYRFRSRGNS